LELTQEKLKTLLTYNPDTGVFTRNVLPRNGCKKVGNIRKDGYVVLSINRKRYLAHRLAFLYMTGSFPEEIDHIDGNPNNNRWVNLRVCTRSQNNMNKGVAGVYFHRSGKWLAQITNQGVHYYLGLYVNRNDAMARYQEAKQKLHGEYARNIQ
jgi:hypothetical protein